MNDTVPRLDLDELLSLPIYGRHGRVAHVRNLLGLNIGEFTDLLAANGGTRRRETVSRWINLSEETGMPRQRISATNAAALEQLVLDQFGVLANGAFDDPEAETPLNQLQQVQRQQAEQLERMEQMLAEIRRLLDPGAGP